MKTIIKTIVPSSRIGGCPHSIKSKFGKLILGMRFYYLYYLSFASSNLRNLKASDCYIKKMTLRTNITADPVSLPLITKFYYRSCLNLFFY